MDRNANNKSFFFSGFPFFLPLSTFSDLSPSQSERDWRGDRQKNRTSNRDSLLSRSYRERYHLRFDPCFFPLPTCIRSISSEFDVEVGADTELLIWTNSLLMFDFLVAGVLGGLSSGVYWNTDVFGFTLTIDKIKDFACFCLRGKRVKGKWKGLRVLNRCLSISIFPTSLVIFAFLFF